MKKSLAALALIAITSQANADTILGGDAEFTIWHQKADVTDVSEDSEAVYAVEVSLEHPIPLIPNLKLGTSSAGGDQFSYTKRDVTGYYEILDNSIVSIDTGFGVSSISSGEYKGTDFEGLMPHLYGKVELGIPATNLYVYAKGYGASDGESSLMDVSGGLKYEIGMGAIDLELLAGYRTHEVDFANKNDFVKVNGNVNGAFIGVNIDI